MSPESHEGLVEVSDLHVKRVVAVPAKAHAILSIDSYLPKVLANLLELVTRRHEEFVNTIDNVDLIELSKSGLRVGSKSTGCPPVSKERLCLGIPEALDHTLC